MFLADDGSYWGPLPTESEIFQFRTPRRWLFRQFLDNSQCCATLLQNESTKTCFHWKSVVGFRDWLAENGKLSCFRIYMKRSAKRVPGSQTRYHVLAFPGKPLSAHSNVHMHSKGEVSNSMNRESYLQSINYANKQKRRAF